VTKRIKKEDAQLHQELQGVSPDYLEIQTRFAHMPEIFFTNVNPAFAFSIAFAQMFLSDTPYYKMKRETYGATRTSWTYHTDFSIGQTAKMMNLICKFEALGKRDAVIETSDEDPQIVLVAEWEWDFNDIFGKGKELEKLKSSCKDYKTADAFLLTYCPASNYLDFLQSIIEYWVKGTKTQKRPPTLYAHIVIFQEKAGFREFDKLRTVEINSQFLDVWSEQYF